MVHEHEIAVGSKLYFAQTARLKREIEDVASTVLEARGFEEIVTPLFSHHQHMSLDNANELIRVNDESNHHVTLRADSTLDVVRIIDKRLGRNTDHKKWFYIQPIFRYPSIETYQVGAEFIGEEKLEVVLDVAIEIFNKLECQPLLQLSNINIPKLLVEEFGFTIEQFRRIEVQALRSKGYDWMEDLIYLNKPEQITDALLEKVPASIKPELVKLKQLAEHVQYAHVVVAPLYYDKMRYYDELFFRFINNNDLLSRGGRYQDENIHSVGFALYTDELIDTLDKKRRG